MGDKSICKLILHMWPSTPVNSSNGEKPLLNTSWIAHLRKTYISSCTCSNSKNTITYFQNWVHCFIQPFIFFLSNNQLISLLNKLWVKLKTWKILAYCINNLRTEVSTNSSAQNFWVKVAKMHPAWIISYTKSNGLVSSIAWCRTKFLNIHYWCTKKREADSNTISINKISRLCLVKSVA